MMVESYDIIEPGITVLITEGKKKIVKVTGFGYVSRFYKDFANQKSFCDNDFGLIIPQISARHEIKSRPITIDDHVGVLGDVISEASKRYDFSEFYLSGHSFGASIALKYASLYPDEIKGIGVMNPCMPVPHGMKKHISNYFQLIIEGLLGIEKNMSGKFGPYVENLFRLGIGNALDIVQEIVDYNVDFEPLKMPAMAIYSNQDRLYRLTPEIQAQFDEKGVLIDRVNANHNYEISHPYQAAKKLSGFFSDI